MFNISKPLEFYYWSTPNGDKIAILLEELSIPYDLKPINILRGDQYSPEFLAISPNNKIPAIKQDNQTLFESGAIMLILAETTQQLIPIGKRNDTLQWLFWQMGGLGPMAGQNHHFNFYAPEPIPYAKERYIKETKRLYGVLETQLTGREYIVGRILDCGHRMLSMGSASRYARYFIARLSQYCKLG